jgi:hypothetical protein
MPAPLINFPIANIVDALLSYTQHLFSKPEITPAEYRWSADDRASKIRICAPFVIDNEKPMSAPFIVIERGGFEIDDRIMDDLKSADANTFDNANKTTIWNGFVNVVVGSGVASEASSIANFVAIMFRADRHGIVQTVNFIRNIRTVDVGPEIPVVKDVEVKRWEVTVRLFVSLQMGWIDHILEPVIWEKAAIYAHEPPNPDPLSNKGIVSVGSDLLVDSTKHFGPFTTDDPQLLSQELQKGWYYIRFKNLDTEDIYPVAEIVDEHTLRLFYHDANNQTIPWSSPVSKTDVEYQLLWNNIHLHVEIPN